MDSIELINYNTGIKIIIKEKWCNLFFVHNEEIRLLGSNTVKKVLKPLMLSFLPAKNRKTYGISGKELFEIMYLSEPHSIILGEKKDNNMNMYQIDANGELNFLLSINEETQNNWAKIINDYSPLKEF
ncbi:hypothetical protein SAMN04487760_1102 [Lachnospiraceae bacterium G41]|nr:hypothetical protein SAMN04487760_1102 [Lachnospiraceae bacterium G41]